MERFNLLGLFLLIGANIQSTTPQFARTVPLYPNTNFNQWPTLGVGNASAQHNSPLKPVWSNQSPRLSTTTPWPELGKSQSNRGTNVSLQIPVWTNQGPQISSTPPSPGHGNQQTNNGRGANTNDQFDYSHAKPNNNIGHERASHRARVPDSVSDEELKQFSESLLQRESDTIARYVNVNYQGKTTSRSKVDQAPLPLLAIQKEAYAIPTVSKLARLYDNYVPEVNVMEMVTFEERTEENDFLDAVVASDIMQLTQEFLRAKGNITGDTSEFKNLLREIWFDMYSRQRGQLGSSGFEHVFLGELKNNEVSGFHNWLFFSEEEIKGAVDYLGYMKKVDLNDRGAIITCHFKFRGADKPYGSLFIGTSPEFEMALYTTCFLLRANRPCQLKLNGKRVVISTFTFNYKGKKLIGSAFPQI